MWYRVRAGVRGSESWESCEFANRQLGQEAFTRSLHLLRTTTTSRNLFFVTTTTSLLKHAFMHEACHLICASRASPTPFKFDVRERLPQTLTTGVEGHAYVYNRTPASNLLDKLQAALTGLHTAE